jgi:hypothetical protein
VSSAHQNRGIERAVRSKVRVALTYVAKLTAPREPPAFEVPSYKVLFEVDKNGEWSSDSTPPIALVPPVRVPLMLDAPPHDAHFGLRRLLRAAH